LIKNNHYWKVINNQFGWTPSPSAAHDKTYSLTAVFGFFMEIIFLAALTPPNFIDSDIKLKRATDGFLIS
jgi:hypothetical protein